MGKTGSTGGTWKQVGELIQKKETESVQCVI